MTLSYTRNKFGEVIAAHFVPDVKTIRRAVLSVRRATKRVDPAKQTKLQALHALFA